MWKCVSIFLISALFWSYVFPDCTTPLGKRSKCVSLDDCPDLRKGFKQRPLSHNISRYVQKSHCEFAGKIPRVCCGPFPDGYLKQGREQSEAHLHKIFNGDSDGYFPEDSLLTPRNKCGIDTNGNRIFGGHIAEIDEFPWMALLGYKTSSGAISYQCSGFLINHRYVLTAAHCLTGAVLRAFGPLHTVRLGEYDTEKDIDCVDDTCADPPQEIPVASVFANSGFKDEDGSPDDIGIVRLAKRAVFTYYVQPICLVKQHSKRVMVGDLMYIAGWGKTLSGPKSNVKRKLSVSIFNQHKCLSKYNRLGRALGKKQLCAGGVFREDACIGDSGGPLMKTKRNGVWEAVGLISFGHGCGRDGWPAVYTALDGYLDWINSTLKSSNQ